MKEFNEFLKNIDHDKEVIQSFENHLNDIDKALQILNGTYPSMKRLNKMHLTLRYESDESGHHHEDCHSVSLTGLPDYDSKELIKILMNEETRIKSYLDEYRDRYNLLTSMIKLDPKEYQEKYEALMKLTGEST